MTLGPLAPLAAYRQFIPVLLVPEGNGKTKKLPVRFNTGEVCDAHDPTAWTDYETAAAWPRTHGPTFCVGFVLTENDPFFCLDVDGCRNGNEWSPEALGLLAALPGTVVEVSQSGNGLHAWGRRSAMPPHKSKNVQRRLELYSSKRFIALGTGAVGTMADDCTAVDGVVAAFFPPIEAGGQAVPDEGPRADWRGPTDDDDLIRRALQSKSASGVFGGKASFADLWDADADVLARAYPTEAGNPKPYDASSADAALAQHLAFWTGCDQARIERLMRRSKLARDKWERDDYMARTIGNACKMQRDVLQDKPSAVEQAAGPAGSGVTIATPSMTAVEGSVFLGHAEQAQLFNGCVYILEEHRVLIPGGSRIRAEQFRANFGGFVFTLDAGNTKTTRNAFEAFTESQVLRKAKADGTCFRPDLPFGTIITEGGRSRANFYWPAEVESAPGDVGLFLDLLQRMLPHERDRRMLLSYMARNVQSPGVKAQWAVLLQGVEGNGKTFLARALAAAVGRRYVAWPKAKKIVGQFNGWLYGNLLAVVEEIATGADADVLDELKPMITGGDGLEIEAKGIDQVTREICLNFLFLTNHKNALKKTRNDRRFAVLYCPQQSVEDLARDGLTVEYMAALYRWFNNGGAAAITHFLRTYEVDPEFDYAGACQRAPRTSSTDEAIAASLGPAEQEIAEAIEQGLVGFKGGWVSSVALENLLQRIGKSRALPLSRRREVMRGLGYDWHPHLPDGRVQNIIMPDGSKPRLYILEGHPSRTIASPAEVARAYTRAQDLSGDPSAK